MKKQPAYSRFKAGLLALIFIASWSLRMGHALFLHHVHHAVPVCAAAQEGHVTHLHDARYNPDDCSVCAFLFAVPELSFGPVIPPAPEAIVACNLLPGSTTPYLSFSGDARHLRGPPAL